MSIIVQCPNCRTTLEVEDGSTGKVAHCPSCRKPFSIPSLPVSLSQATANQQDEANSQSWVARILVPILGYLVLTFVILPIATHVLPEGWVPREGFLAARGPLVQVARPAAHLRDPILDAQLLDAPIQVVPRNDIDERLFLIYVLENMYGELPFDEDRRALASSLGMLRHRVHRHYDYLDRKDIDPMLTAIFGDLLNVIDDYATYLSEQDLIERQAMARAEKESAEAGFAAGFQGGKQAAEMHREGYNSGDAALAGVATTVLLYIWDDYNKSKLRDEAKRQAVMSAFARLENSRSSALARAQTSSMELEERCRWKKGEAGFDVDNDDRRIVARFVQANDVSALARYLDEVKRRRPRDPFAILHSCKLKASVPNSTPSELIRLAKECLEAATLVPAGSFYDEYRSSFLHSAGDLANRAWSLEFGEVGFGNADSRKARWAVRIWDVCLTYEPKDSSGEIRARRGWALFASGQLEDALNQLNGVMHVRKNTIAYAYIMAKLYSCLRQKEAIEWFEHAVQNLGYDGINFARSDPDLAWMRRTQAARFNSLTEVKYEWRIDWGLLSDDIVFTNKSPFAITNVEFTPLVESTGYFDWTRTFRADRMEAGRTYRWNTRITARGNNAAGRAYLNCDQTGS